MDAPQPVRKPRRLVGRRKTRISSGGSLSEEIEMLREAFRQVWILSEQNKKASDWMKTLDNLGKACQRLAAVLKAEGELNQGESIGEIVLRLAPEAWEESKRLDQEKAGNNQPAIPGLLGPAPTAIVPAPLAAGPSTGAPSAGSAESAKAGELNGDIEQP